MVPVHAFCVSQYFENYIIADKLHSRSVDPQKNRHNYLITHSILKFPTPCRSLSQRRSFDIYISAVGSETKRLAVLP